MGEPVVEVPLRGVRTTEGNEVTLTLLSDPMNNLDNWMDGRHLEARIATFDGNKVGRVMIPKGEHFGTDLRFPVGYEEATIRYRVRRSPNWHQASNWSGKMLGFADLRWNTGYGHRQPTTAGGGSWRGLFGHPEGNQWGVNGNQLGVYYYHLDQKFSYGDSLYFGVGSDPGDWSEFQMKVYVGSDGHGLIEGSVNDGPIAGTTFRCAPGTQVDIAWWDVYHGGGAGKTPSEDIYMDFDDITITVPGTPQPPSSTAWPTVKRGDGWQGGITRDHVRRAQAWLAIAGYVASNTFDARHKPDGLFGPGTESAVRAFQNMENLTANGIVGPSTWERLLNWTI